MKITKEKGSGKKEQKRVKEKWEGSRKGRKT